MSLWRQLSFGVRNLFGRERRNGETAEELEHFLDMAIEERRRDGQSAQDAARSARIELGSLAAAKDTAQSYGWENHVHSIARDLRFAARQLWRHGAFTASVVVTLAIGIGANTAIFTVVQSVLLTPLPYKNADRLVHLDTHWSNTGHDTPRMTGPDAIDAREQVRSFEAVSLYFGGNEGVQLRDHGVYTTVTWVDRNFARVFDLQPIAGRLFDDTEAHRAALVSEHFARENFGSAQAAVGQVMHVETEAIEIAGVLPNGFDFPDQTEVWEAASLQPDSHSRTAFNYRVVGLLRAGVSFSSAQAELSQFGQRLQAAYPAENRNKEFVAVPLKDEMTGYARSTLLLLWGGVTIILLIACVNVANLQLVRSLERQRELAIRRALGSSRWQVMRPVLLEGLLMALMGGVGGILLAWPAVRLLVANAPRELPRAAEIHLSLPVLAFTLCVSILTAVLFSLVPALRAAKVDPAEALKQNILHGMNSKRSTALRNSLVVAEVAATFVLAVAAGLLLHTMMELTARDMGYDTRQLLVVDADVPAHTDEDYHRAIQQFNEMFTKLSAIPGVEHAAGIMGLPTSEYGSNGYYETQGGLSFPVDDKPWALFNVASPGYFRAMEIPMKRGRDFGADDTDKSAMVAIVSESLARQSFGDADPVGRQIRCGLDTDKWMTIVGVVSDVRQSSPADKPGPALYMPMTQHPGYANQIHIVLRTHVKPLSVMSAAQRTIRGVNPLAALRFTTMDRMVSNSVAAHRFRAVLTVGFAVVALLLATMGVYGTIAYTVTQRTFEIGIRMAFGADKFVILLDVVKSAAWLAVWGIGVGLALSLMLTRSLTAMLADVRPADPASMGAAAVILMATALLAGLVPGWRAMG
ncbi:MAG: ABC transporter permease, partial [Terracidiphilus sp.]